MSCKQFNVVDDHHEGLEQKGESFYIQGGNGGILYVGYSGTFQE